VSSPDDLLWLPEAVPDLEAPNGLILAQGAAQGGAPADESAAGRGDDRYLDKAVRLLSWLIPGEMRVFRTAELYAAKSVGRRWLQSKDASIGTSPQSHDR